jgi:hypothetical protein
MEDWKLLYVRKDETVIEYRTNDSFQGLRCSQNVLHIDGME